MKYFTYSSLAGDNPEEDHAIASKYHPYLESITPDLPSELQRFLRKCCLHDATLLHLDLSVDDHELRMEFVGDHYAEALAPEEKIPDNYARRFWLTYRGVKSFTMTGEPKRRSSWTQAYCGEFAYDEFEILGPKFYEQRMIFSTGIEFQIHFADFLFKYEDFEYKGDA